MNKKKRRPGKLIEKVADQYHMQLFHVFPQDLKILKQFQKEFINTAAIPSEIDSTKAESSSVQLSNY